MMAEKWTKPDLGDVRLAVEEALSDLESIRAEILSVNDQYTTGARILRHDYWGTLAAMRKRLAEVEFLAGGADWRSTLSDALADCRSGLEEGARADHWILGQYVVLRAVLGETPKKPAAVDAGGDVWSEKAWRAAELALENLDPQERMWAHSSIADLLMVARAEGVPGIARDHQRDVLAELQAMIEVGGGPSACPAVWPTFRQFWRWQYWWKNEKWADEAQRGFDYLWAIVRPRFMV